MKWWHLIGVLLIGYVVGILLPGPGQKVKAAVSGVTG
jgi:hypothetical protein